MKYCPNCGNKISTRKKNTTILHLVYGFGVVMAVVSALTVENDGNTPVWMVVVASVLGMSLSFGFIWLVIKDPDRLQTGEWRGEIDE